jgi:hypothetical protein
MSKDMSALTAGRNKLPIAKVIRLSDVLFLVIAVTAAACDFVIPPQQL